MIILNSQIISKLHVNRWNFKAQNKIYFNLFLSLNIFKEIIIASRYHNETIYNSYPATSISISNKYIAPIVLYFAAGLFFFNIFIIDFYNRLTKRDRTSKNNTIDAERLTPLPTHSSVAVWMNKAKIVLLFTYCVLGFYQLQQILLRAKRRIVWTRSFFHIFNIDARNWLIPVINESSITYRLLVNTYNTFFRKMICATHRVSNELILIWRFRSDVFTIAVPFQNGQNESASRDSAN